MKYISEPHPIFTPRYHDSSLAPRDALRTIPECGGNPFSQVQLHIYKKYEN
jgi:hypothetical protein